jgi:uncharacterized protein YyaL (SSP411 family)
MTNRLASSSSPYLRQHANNPVDWYEWGPEAFAQAVEHDRPIFLSVGYAACHWCHVMAHESFESPEIAALINENFIAVKVDREERPDLDAIYMAATQAIGGHGGWPMTVFLTPDARPFMAGTYYPPEDRPGQPGMRRLLTAMHEAWELQRDTVEKQASEVVAAVERETRYIDRLELGAPGQNVAEIRDHLTRQLLERADADGGFSGAPKFPRPSYIRTLLASWAQPEVADVITDTLNVMARRGLYDHLTGGFARYCVDAEWRVPHYEKMLSDNALLALCYREAAAVAHHDEWAAVANATCEFLVESFLTPQGFVASFDADTRDGEGRHVTWTAEEVHELLEEPLASAVCARYVIAPAGDGDDHGRSVPRLAGGETFEVPEHLVDAVNTLRGARQQRPQPSVDDKIILEWNAMAIVALLRSATPAFVTVALEVLDGLPRSHFDGDVWWRTNARAHYATAADVAWLLEAYCIAYETSGDDRHLGRAEHLVAYLLTNFWEGDLPTAHIAHRGHGICHSDVRTNDLPIRAKEIFDGATPSSHAMATEALARFALLSGNENVTAVARHLRYLAEPLLRDHPVAVPDLVLAISTLDDPYVLVTPGSGELVDSADTHWLPQLIRVRGTGASPWLTDRREGAAYLCEGHQCLVPAESREELDAQVQAIRERLVAR